MLTQLQHCEDNGIPIAIVLGESEMQRNVVKLRVIKTREEIEVSLDQMVDLVRNKLIHFNSGIQLTNGDA